MSVDLNSKLNNFDARIIDTQNISEVSNQIFVNARSKGINVENFDLSKFKKVDLGLEVYGRQISVDKATQIAIRQSGIDVQLTQNFKSNIKYLNTQMAISNNRDISKNIMTGKIHTPVEVNNVDKAREVFELPKSGNIFSIASMNKDKSGSDGTSYFGGTNKKAGESKEDNKELSIFA